MTAFGCLEKGSVGGVAATAGLKPFQSNAPVPRTGKSGEVPGALRVPAREVVGDVFGVDVEPVEEEVDFVDGFLERAAPVTKLGSLSRSKPSAESASWK